MLFVDDGHQYKTHRVVLDVIRHTFSENALTSTIRDNTGSSLSTDDSWIIGSTWSRGFSGVHKMFMKPEIRLNQSPTGKKNLLKPEIGLKSSPVNSISRSAVRLSPTTDFLVHQRILYRYDVES